jgi:hypothetical protein
VSERAAPADQHYTIVEIKKMHQKFGGRTLGKIKENLKSIYRLDTRDGVLLLKWGDTELGYDDSLTFLKAVDGTPYVKNFNFDVNGKSVSGWAGILDSGGRTKAGFAVARRRGRR